MKMTKIFTVAAVAMASVGAFADAANVLVSFETKSDKYADGTPVMDGEWYALCWSSDGNFEGITPGRKPTDPNDLVCLMAPLAKGGRCPYTVFQIDSKSSNCKRNGKYTVILLDTRGGTDGKPSKDEPTVFAAVATKDYTAGSATAGASEDKTSGTGDWVHATVDVAEVKNPIIKGFKVISDAQVQIDVEDLTPEVRYTVKMGESLDKIDTYPGAVRSGSETATFLVDPKSAKFFQVVREPLTEPLTK